MRWLVDECVDAGLVAWLRHTGDDVLYIAELAPAENDAAVLQRSRSEMRLLLTEDKDFGDLIFRQRYDVPGIVLSRIDPSKHALKWMRLKAVIERIGNDLYGRYTTIEEERFRSRPLPR